MGAVNRGRSPKGDHQGNDEFIRIFALGRVINVISRSLMQWGVRALSKQTKLGAETLTALNSGIQLMTAPGAASALKFRVDDC